jgi:hypothetical protein
MRSPVQAAPVQRGLARAHAVASLQQQQSCDWGKCIGALGACWSKCIPFSSDCVPCVIGAGAADCLSCFGIH